MNNCENHGLGCIKKAVELVLQGSFRDAIEILDTIDLGDASPFRDVAASMRQLTSRLIEELTSKESAFASVQTAMWELEEAQGRLRKTEARLRTTLVSIGDGLISTDADGCIDFMNPVAETLTGWSLSEAVGRPVDEVFNIIHAKTRTKAFNPVESALQDGVVTALANHTVLIASDGTERQIADSCAPIHSIQEDRILGAVLVFRDVTEDYRRREMLRENEERYRTLFNSSLDALMTIESSPPRYTSCNPAALKLFGVNDEAEFLSLGPTDLSPEFQPDGRLSAESGEEHAQKALREGSSDFTFLHRRLDGVEFNAAVLLTRVELNERVVLQATVRDVTKQQRAETALRESESRLRVITDAAQDAITMMDAEGRISFWNPAAERIFGYTSAEAIGRELHSLIAPDRYRDTYKPGLATFRRTGSGPAVGKTRDLEARRKDGKEVLVQLSLSTIRIQAGWHAVGVLRDITEQRKLETGIQHARKLEAVGQLAAGIAHEINTPAQFVGDSIHFLADSCREVHALVGKYREVLPQLAKELGSERIIREIQEAEEKADLCYIEENLPAAFQRAQDGISRISTIVGAMKEFSHPDLREKAPADLNQALTTTLVIARNEYKYVADVETDLGDIPPVTCHLGDLNQVFLNLLVNAAHAISDVVGTSGAKGTITVKSAVDGAHVRVEIKDTGGGIPEPIHDRIFEPFFTTKEVGRGSGQGLAIARSVVVDKHGGELTFETTSGKGTSFIIRLPIDGGNAQETPSRGASDFVTNEKPLSLEMEP